MMKKNLLWFCSMVLFASVLTINFTSCVEDPCADVFCNNGTCFEGTCRCDVGFELDPVTGDCIPADPCDGVECGDNATCFDGNCECDTGFVMDANGNCERAVARFIGNYNTTEPNCGITDPYPVVIEQVAGQPNGIFITNLGDFICILDGNEINYDVFATVDGNTLAINSDETCSIVFNGTGTLDNNIITIDYSAVLPDTTFICTALLERQ